MAVGISSGRCHACTALALDVLGPGLALLFVGTLLGWTGNGLDGWSLLGLVAWLVGLLLAFRLNTIQAGTGNGEEFEYIIAAVVGGTLLTGGYGTAIGAMIGAFIMAIANQGPSFAGWNTDWKFVFLGTILLGSAYANGAIRKRAEALK